MTRQRVLRGARAAFVVLTIACAWWGFRGRWTEIGGAVADTGLLRLVAAVGCAVVGLVLTGILWRLLLRWVGSEVGVRDSAAVFYVGQLGKYVPGSVWSVAAQAQLGRRHDVPVRSSVTASALFLLVHTASGLLLGGLLVVGGALGRTAPDEVGHWCLLAVGAGAVALVPGLLRRLGDRLAGRGASTTLGAAAVAQSVALMTLVWACYGASLLLLVPDAASSPGWLGTTAAFALAHAVGVLIVFAPAGVGAREAVLVALLAPSVGVPAAVAAALLVRLVHALADFLLAGAATGWARGGRNVPAPEPAHASGR